MQTRLLTIFLMVFLSSSIAAHSQGDAVSEKPPLELEQNELHIVQLPDGVIRVEVIEKETTSQRSLREREEQIARDEQSLALQRRSVEIAGRALSVSHWALGISAVASIAALVGGVFVFLQLNQARRATENADVHAQAQNRAYVLIDATGVARANVILPDGTKDPAHFRIYGEWIKKNTGNTPAREVRSGNRFMIGTLEQVLAAEIHEPTSTVVLGANVTMKTEDLLDQVWTQADIDAAYNRGETAWLRGFTEYRDMFGVMWRNDYLLYIPNFARYRVPCASCSFRMHSTGNSFSKIEENGSD